MVLNILIDKFAKKRRKVLMEYPSLPSTVVHRKYLQLETISFNKYDLVIDRYSVGFY